MEHRKVDWLVVARAYREQLAQGSAGLQDGFGESWAWSACVCNLGGPDAGQLENRLQKVDDCVPLFRDMDAAEIDRIADRVLTSEAL